jgi:hypothetical protein
MSTLYLTPGEAAIRLGIAAHELRRLHLEQRLPVPLNDLPRIAEACRNAGLNVRGPAAQR